MTEPGIPPTQPPPNLPASPFSLDGVFEGGGVNGMGLVGAAAPFEAAGAQWYRVAGASAGAIFASLVAAGYGIDKPNPAKPALPTLHRMLDEINYIFMEDQTNYTKIPVVGQLLSVGADKGIYKGEALRTFIADKLAAAGVRTWADLKIANDPGGDPNVPPEQRYKLMVVVSDTTRRQMMRFPWDYSQYGFSSSDIDKLSVADVVYASCAIPGFFRPLEFTSKAVPGGAPAQLSYLVDGGVVSNFPIDAFDRLDGQPPRFPTVGFRLESRPDPSQPFTRNDTSYAYGVSLFQTMLHGKDNATRNDPRVAGRSIFIGAPYDATDFNITQAQRDQLYTNGQQAAEAFIASGALSRHANITMGRRAAQRSLGSLSMHSGTAGAIPTPLQRPGRPDLGGIS